MSGDLLTSVGITFPKIIEIKEEILQTENNVQEYCLYINVELNCSSLVISFSPTQNNS